MTNVCSDRNQNLPPKGEFLRVILGNELVGKCIQRSFWVFEYICHKTQTSVSVRWCQMNAGNNVVEIVSVKISELVEHRNGELSHYLSYKHMLTPYINTSMGTRTNTKLQQEYNSKSRNIRWALTNKIYSTTDEISIIKVRFMQSFLFFVKK